MEILSTKPKPKKEAMDPQTVQMLSFLVDQAVASAARSILAASEGKTEKIVEAINHLANSRPEDRQAPVANINLPPRQPWAGEFEIIRDARGDAKTIKVKPYTT